MTMDAKIVTVLIALALQGNQAETVDDVIASLTPQITTVRNTIDTITQNGRSTIIQTRKTIGLTIAEAEDVIHDQLDQLDDVITQAEHEANEKGVDISSCVSDVSVALSDLDTKKFEACGSYQDLNLIGTQFGNLRQIKGELSRSVNLCKFRSGGDLDALRGCIQISIDDARTRSNEVQQTINRVCDDATKNASKCVEGVVEELDVTISNVAHDLKQCLLRIL